MNPQIQIMLQQAMQDFQLGYLKKAEEVLSHCAQLDPKIFDVLHLLAIVYASQEKHQSAIECYKKALELSPNDASALSNLGSSLNAIGHNQEALSVFQKALKIDPSAPIAWYNAANILCDTGEYKEALTYYEQSIKLNPNYYQAYINYGKLLFELKRYSESLTSYDKALGIDQNSFECLINKGATLKELALYEEAIAYYDKALSLNPEFAEAWSNKGVTLHELKRYEEATAHYDKALSLKPEYAECWSNKGVTLSELKRYEEAIAHYDKAISLKPDYHEAWSNKGVTLSELKRYEEAIAHYDKALSLKPDYAEAYFNKGNTFNELKRYEEAIAHYDKALSFKPDYAEGWSNKGNVLNELKRYDEAIAHYDKALSFKPDYAEGWSNKGNVLNELKRYDEAIAHYDKALSLKPNIDWIYGELLNAKMKICEWSSVVDESKNIISRALADERVATPFTLLCISDDSFLHKKTSQIYSQDKYPSNFTLGSIPRTDKKEKIRIAYFSPDFRAHPVSFLTAELFEFHDRSRFEVFAFSLHQAPIGDEMNLRLRRGFDKFIDVENMSDQEIAQLARQFEIDIAIDLAGFTQHSRTGIFSYRAAPIQVNWLGYPGTIGAGYIDYILADKTIIPESHQQFYAEKVFYLPDGYMVDDSRRVASSRIFTREECGLPQNTLVFCCFNNGYKFNPQILDSWSNILFKVVDSVLWISENNKEFKANIATEFEKRGIDPNRIIYAQRVELMADHLARFRLADLFLDTYPYNAHTTAVDSLKSGVPVLTCMSKSFAGRVAASLLSAIGLSELITNNREEYEALAIELALNPKKLADIKLKLASNCLTAPLFDTPLFTKNIESAYIKMYERYLADLLPEQMLID